MPVQCRLGWIITCGLAGQPSQQQKYCSGWKRSSHRKECMWLECCDICTNAEAHAIKRKEDEIRKQMEDE